MTKSMTLIAIFAFLCSFNAFASWKPGEWNSGKVGSTEFLAYVPTNLPAGTAQLMINLHGCSQTADDLMKAGNWKEAAERYHMIVVLPKVPNGGVIFGCWDYYGRNHTTANRHNAPLIALTEALIAEPDLGIDKKRVYISGLSSGGGQAFVEACLRPDLFAGVGLSSSPVLGSDKYDLYRPAISAQDSAQLCRDLAGTEAAALSTQLTSIIVGDQDYIVNNVHSTMSAQVMADVYQVATQEDLDPTELTGANTAGHGVLLSDAQGHKRVSLIINNGLGHAWPAGNAGAPNGEPAGGNFINAKSVNYPMYLAKFFTENNLRGRQKRAQYCSPQMIRPSCFKLW